MSQGENFLNNESHNNSAIPVNQNPAGGEILDIMVFYNGEFRKKGGNEVYDGQNVKKMAIQVTTTDTFDHIVNAVRDVFNLNAENPIHLRYLRKGYYPEGYASLTVDDNNSCNHFFNFAKKTPKNGCTKLFIV